MSTQEITWRLDPSVWQRAVFGRHEALLWWTGPSTRTGWCIYQVGGMDPLEEGTGADEDDAKAQAEGALRRHEASLQDRENHS